jgi:type IV pilus assembly protein PilZ
LRSPSNKPGLLTLTIKDKSALYLAYMPFVKNGGLFIPTNSNYRLGDEVFMLLNLMGEEEKLPVAGRVIWMTPKGAQGKRTAGIGVQFSDQDRGNTQKKIENYLAGALGGDKPTHTMFAAARACMAFHRTLSTLCDTMNGLRESIRYIRYRLRSQSLWSWR